MGSPSRARRLHGADQRIAASPRLAMARQRIGRGAHGAPEGPGASAQAAKRPWCEESATPRAPRGGRRAAAARDDLELSPVDAERRAPTAGEPALRRLEVPGRPRRRAAGQRGAAGEHRPARRRANRLAERSRTGSSVRRAHHVACTTNDPRVEARRIELARARRPPPAAQKPSAAAGDRSGAP
jgi:hypothetical protein